MATIDYPGDDGKIKITDKGASMMTWEEIVRIFNIDWAVGLGFFIIWCAVMFTLKRFLYSTVKKLAKKTKTRLDNIIIDSLNIPLIIIIIFIGLYIFGEIINPPDILMNYFSIFTIIVIISSITIFIDRLIVGYLKVHDEGPSKLKLAQGVFQGLVRAIIYLLGVFILLSNIGVNISPLIASLGIGTLAVALALQSTLANFFSGLFVMMDKSISVGDFVQLETGEQGYVDEIGWRASRIRLLTNSHVIIPNAKLVDSVVTNYQAPTAELFTYVDCGVHYNSDLAHVEKVALEVAREVIDEVDGTVKGQDVRFWFKMFDASSINFRLRVGCVDYGSTFTVQHELIKRLHKRFNEEGIVIPFPLRTLDFQPKDIKLIKEIASIKEQDGS